MTILIGQHWQNALGRGASGEVQTRPTQDVVSLGLRSTKRALTI